jgi:transcriptional regulator with XRE-family HTH domain
MNEFKARLQEAAKYAGIEQHQAGIASSLNLSRQTVNRWFHGWEPNAKMLLHIARCWSVDAQWLKDGTGTMLQTPSPDGLSAEERDLVKDYRSATPKVREFIRTTARAVRKSVVMIAAVIPPLLVPSPTDARVLHNQNFMPNSSGILIALRRLRAWLQRANPLFVARLNLGL